LIIVAVVVVVAHLPLMDIGTVSRAATARLKQAAEAVPSVRRVDMVITEEVQGEALCQK
jgi:hypothetical protein